MFCSQCGAKNSDTARFCTACGAPLGSKPVAGQQPRADGARGVAAPGNVSGNDGGPVSDSYAFVNLSGLHSGGNGADPAAAPVASGSGQPAATAPVSAPRKRKLPAVAVVAAALVLVVAGVAVWGFALGGFSSSSVSSSAVSATAKTYVLDSTGTETLYCTETLNEDGVVVASYRDYAAELEAMGYGSDEFETYTYTRTYTDDGDLLSYEEVVVYTDAYKEESEYAIDEYYLETYAYEYDDAGNPTSVTVYVAVEEGVEPTQTATALLEYDSEGRLVSITTIDANEYTLEASITYTADGAVSTFAWSATALDDPSDTGGLTTWYTYDDDGRLTKVASDGMGVIYLLAYDIGGMGSSFDGSIRILCALHDIQELVWGSGAYASYEISRIFIIGGTYGFDYNEQGDLERVWYESETVGEVNQCTYEYEYDTQGRITKLTEQEYDQDDLDEQATPLDYQTVTYYEYR